MTETHAEQQGPIAEVHEGMTVVDVVGEKVGTVRAVRMGDPGAVTSEGQGAAEDVQGGVVGALARVFSAADPVPDGLRERLLRLGFVQIDAAGLFTGDRYAASDEIAEVAGETVHLSVGKDMLAG